MPAKNKTKTTPRIRRTANKDVGRARQPAKAAASKKEIVLRLLRRQNGASITEIAAETDWMPHSVRGFLTATVRKKLELPLVSTKEPGSARRYHVAALKSAKG